MPDVLIQSDGLRTRVVIDGVELANAVSLSLDVTSRNVPRLSIEYFCYETTEFNGNAIVAHHCPMGLAPKVDSGE